MLSVNRNCPDKWNRRPFINWNCPENCFHRLSSNWNCLNTWFQVMYMNWKCRDDCFRRLSIDWNYPHYRVFEGSVIWKPAATTAVPGRVQLIDLVSTLQYHATIASRTGWRTALHTQSLARYCCIMLYYERYRYNGCLLYTSPSPRD